MPSKSSIPLGKISFEPMHNFASGAPFWTVYGRSIGARAIFGKRGGK